MAKLERLQWIPMVIKAFQDARERTGAQGSRPVLNGATGAFSSSVTDPVGHVPSPVKREPKRASRRKAPIQFGRRRQPKKLATTGPFKTWNAQQYRAVMKEIRETKQKLSQLEAIQHQLQQMQSTFESHLHRMKTSGPPVSTTRTLSDEAPLPDDQVNK